MNTFEIRRISQPSQLDSILSLKWELVHLPTAGIAGRFRLKKTASSAADWFNANLNSEALQSVDVAVFVDASKRAGWLSKHEELRRMEAGK